jgi:hypothetical protein
MIHFLFARRKNRMLSSFLKEVASTGYSVGGGFKSLCPESIPQGWRLPQQSWTDTPL